MQPIKKHYFMSGGMKKGCLATCDVPRLIFIETTASPSGTNLAGMIFLNYMIEYKNHSILVVTRKSY